MIDATRDPFDIIEGAIQDTDMQFFVVRVNQKIAQEMILHNREPETGKKATNRKASPLRIAEYGKAMGDDEWLVSPQPIVFSAPNDKGETEMIDGQQRIKAFLAQCQEDPGLEVDFTICINAPVGVKMVLDRGKSRTLADVLRMDGHKYANILSPTVKMLYCYNEVPYTTLGQWAAVKLTPTSQEAYLSKHLDLRYAIDQTRATPSQAMGHVAAMVYYLIHLEHGVEKADAFQAGIAMGLVPGASTEDSRWKMREFLAAKSREKYQWSGFEQLGMMIWAANDWLAGWDSFIPGRLIKSLHAARDFPRLLSAAEVGPAKF